MLSLQDPAFVGVAGATAAVATKLWSSTATGESEGMYSGGVTICGELFSTNHVLIGATPTKIVFNLKKNWFSRWKLRYVSCKRSCD